MNYSVEQTVSKIIYSDYIVITTIPGLFDP